MTIDEFRGQYEFLSNMYPVLSPLKDLIEQGPKSVIYCDSEHSADCDNKMVLNKGDIAVVHPSDVPVERVCQAIQELVAIGEVGLIVSDSIPKENFNESQVGTSLN